MEKHTVRATRCSAVYLHKGVTSWPRSGFYNILLPFLFFLSIFYMSYIITAPAVAAEQVLSSQELQKRSDALDHREQSLNTIEADLNARMAKLKDLETILKKMLDEANSVKDTRMQKLVDVYTNMKPQQAASVMETIDVPLAVKVLAGMKSRQAGEILNKMSKTKAAKISEELIKLQVGPDLPKKP